MNRLLELAARVETLAGNNEICGRIAIKTLTSMKKRFSILNNDFAIECSKTVIPIIAPEEVIEDGREMIDTSNIASFFFADIDPQERARVDALPFLNHEDGQL